MPFLPFATVLGFTTLPATVLGVIVGITALNVLATEVAKPRFYGGP